MKDKKYLTETEKYEIWKKKFRKEMQDVLSKAFAKKVGGSFVSGYAVDKWNVYFNVRGVSSDLQKLENDPTLKEIINIKMMWDEPTACCCELRAKTEEEFNTKLGGLKICLF